MQVLNFFCNFDVEYMMASRKIIKKLLQSIAILLLIAIAFPATAYLLLQSDAIQSNLAKRLMKTVSEKLDTRFTVGSIDIAFLYRIRFNDVYLEDLSGDTLIYAKTLTAGIRYVNPVKREVSIGSINFDNAYVALAIDSASELNLNYFIEKLRGSGEKKKGGWTVDFNNLRLHKTRFGLRNYYYEPVEYGINFTDLRVYDIDADVKQFKPSKDSLSFFIKSLSFKEKSGFVLNKLSSKFSESHTFLSFRNVSILTPQSDIHGDEITMRFKNFGQFKADSLISGVRLRVNLSGTSLNFSDIGNFTPVFHNVNQVITISGLINGPINKIRGKNLDIEFGKNSRLLGDLIFEGLPDIKQTFIIADINDFASSASDINQLQLPGNRTLKLPEVVNKFGEVAYTGNFTGFINDFVAYGRFTTDLGIVKTDILFRPDSSNRLGFEGKFNAQEFDLGTLLDASDAIGNISVIATVDGATLAGKSISATLKGNVGQFEFKQYEYTNISISGDLKNKTFNGSVNVNDPNVDLEFLGKVNFSDTIPAFNFTANLTDANLYALNLNRSDPDFRVSCYLIANAHGKSINSMNGEIKVLNSLFVKKDKQLQIYDVSIISTSTAKHNDLQFRSDFLDAELSGDYELTKSGEALKQFITYYLPSLLDSGRTMPVPLKNSIVLTSTTKNIKPVFDFFLPEYDIAENSTFNLSYDPTDQQMQLHFQSDYIHAKSIIWNGLNLNMSGNNSNLVLEAGGRSISLKDRLSFENFTAIANTGSDTTGIVFRWNNWEDQQYKGTISALARVSKKQNHSRPYIDIDIRPSQLIANDTIWNIQPGKIRIDTSSIHINNLAISHLKEFFLIDGAISENPAEVLSVVFNRFNLGHFNGLAATTGYNMGGILSGKATLSSFYSKPLFTSLIKIDSLMVNNEMLGSTEINSSWDNDRKAVILEAYAIRNSLRTINLKGEYLPSKQGKLDFSLEMEKLRLNIFNPYVKAIFGDLRGMASGQATLTGTIKKPVLNGELTLQKTSFTVNYLQTRYNFSDKVSIENNNFYFKNIRIYDPRHNSAYLNGAIRNKYLKDFVLDLTIRSDNFLSLNTKLTDNKHFYGTAYATGVIKITGPPKNLFLDVTATTNQGTNVKIPLSNTGELNEYPFISIIDPSQQDETQTASNYKADLSGLQIRFRLTVTPDAEVQIIIDPVLGEIIKGNGSGNIDMRINTSGDFIMNGDFVIEKGDYLFTLQKVINKQLTIEPGGSIRWDGDPLNATVNITANYTILSASLRDLFGDQLGEDQKVKVDDRVIMTGRLLSPDIKYDIHLPDADESTKMSVDGAMPTNEEKTRQFISLLMTNRFFMRPEMRSLNSTSSGSTYTEAAGVNFSEMLSNQLSNWLSQIVNDLDVDLNYRANREMNSEEVQVALSYQFFNDRLTVNGSVAATNASKTNATKTNADEIVGEFDIDYKLTKNGKIRLKTYNHANNEPLKREFSPYTQGLGVSYKEDFNTFGELLRRIFGKKEESPEPVTSDEE
jgi:hypothetical protein